MGIALSLSVPKRKNYDQSIRDFEAGLLPAKLFYIRTRAEARRGNQQAIARLIAAGRKIPGFRNAAHSSSTPPPRVVTPQAAPRVARVAKPRHVPVQFTQFLDGRCKDLKLAAKILGVTPRPPLVKATIRAAWISLISKHHPDRGGALEAAQAVNAACALLTKFSR